MMVLTRQAGEFLRRYLLAVQFFTRIPMTGGVGRWVGYSPELMRAAVAHLPGVGWLAGMAACCAYAALAFGLPDTPMTVLAGAVAATFATVVLTGALHEDGLADLADGLGGSSDRERALAIMKDSRVGAFGVVALVLVLVSKVALLSVLGALSPAVALSALLAAHAVSRFAPLVLMHTLPYAGDSQSAKSGPLAARIGMDTVLVGAAWCAVPLALATLAQGLVFVAGGLIAGAAALLWLRQLLQRRLQGFTGDALGAAQQLCELAFYLGAALAIGR